MGALEATVTLITRLAWPVALVVIVAMFRGRISQWLTDAPSRVQAGPLSVEWDRKAEVVSHAIPIDAPVMPSRDGIPGGVDALVMTKPGRAVEEAWAFLTVRLADLFADFGLSGGNMPNTMHNAMYWGIAGITPETAAAYNALTWQAHNAEAISPENGFHGDAMERASAYIAASRQLLATIVAKSEGGRRYDPSMVL